MKVNGANIYLVVYNLETERFASYTLERWMHTDLDRYSRKDKTLKITLLILKAFDSADEAEREAARLCSDADANHVMGLI